MLKEIIEEVSKRVERAQGNIAVFNDKRYNPADFSESNYKEIGKGSGKTLLFVDGGNSELISAPGLSLQLIRNAAVIMKENKLITSKKREFYLLATIDSSEKITGKIFHKDNEKAYVIEATRGELGKFCDVVRHTSEIKFAAETLYQVDNGSIVVLDGTLQAINDMEKNHFDALYRDADAKGINVAALAKTTTLMTDQGDSYVAMVNQRGPDKDWYYYPIALLVALEFAVVILIKLFIWGEPFIDPSSDGGAQLSLLILAAALALLIRGSTKFSLEQRLFKKEII